MREKEPRLPIKWILDAVSLAMVAGTLYTIGITFDRVSRREEEGLAAYGATLVPLSNQAESLLTRGKRLPLVVEFGDYQCPFCRRYGPKVLEALSKSSGVGFNSFDCPLTEIHPGAMSTSILVNELQERCGLSPDASHRDLLTGDLRPTTARAIARWAEDPDPSRGSARAYAKVLDSLSIAQMVGVQSTPTYLYVSTDGMLYRFSSADSLLDYLKR